MMPSISARYSWRPATGDSAAGPAKLSCVPRLAALALLLVALVPAADAAASPSVWATVNICDSPAAPDSMGVRASMAGTGRLRRMYMRFSTQYWNGGGWRRIARATSPWLYLGLARRRAVQAGWTFTFDAPRLGTSFRMRGIVDFRWRARRRGRAGRRARWIVVRRRRAVTRGGLSGVQGGDPPGTSLATCLMTG
jgi:hypothetical protein